MQEAFDSGSVDDVRGAAKAITDWAGAEQEWLTAHPPDSCLRVVHDAYGQGLSGIHLGALTLSINLIEPVESSTEEMERAASQLTAGLKQLSHAVDLWSSSTCSAAAPTPPPSLPREPAAAYALLADDINGRWKALREASPDPVALATGLLALQEEMGSRLSSVRFPAVVSADADALQQAINSTTGLLRAAAAGSPETAESEMGVATLTVLPEQRAAASALRAALGLPDLDDADLF